MERYLIAVMCVYYFYIFGFQFYLLNLRVTALKKNEVRLRHFKAYTEQEPENLKIASNHFNSQFQMPVMFLIACLTCLQQQNTSLLVLGLAVGFVLSRFFHTYIHLGSNHLLKRAYSFFFGNLLVGLLFLTNLF